MDQYQTKNANFHSNGREKFMTNVQMMEKEDFGAQPKEELLIILKIQRHGDIVAILAHITKV